jgi:manganese oxidase
MPILDCPICDDTYDFGEKGTNLRSSPFFARLRHGNDPLQQHQDMDVQDNLNTFVFPSNFFTPRWHGIETQIFSAKAADEIMFRIIHPGGRARQRAFIPVGFDYDDLYPGFGVPHSALLAPGKAVSALATAPAEAGCYMWRDGPNQIWASGVWGLLDVANAAGQSSCSRY